MAMPPKKKALVKRSPVFVPLRLALLGACLGWFSRNWLVPMLLPFGPARRLSQIPTYGPVDETNDLLMAKRKSIDLQ
jgi:hypothetical protein